MLTSTTSGPVPYREVVLDASVWVSRQIAGDANHSAASAWVNAHLQSGGSFLEPAWLLVEVAAAISRRMSPKDAQTALALLSRLQRRRIIRFLPLRATLLREIIDIAATNQLRSGDAAYVAVARLFSIPLVSFDRDHIDRAGSIVTVIKL